MEFNFFGNKFELSIKKQEDIEEIKKGNIYDRYNFKISIFLLTFMFFSALFIYYKNKNEYIIGTQAKHDVIAYKTIKYEKDILDKDLKSKILKNTKPEYNRKEDVEKEEISRFTKVLTELSSLDLKNEKLVREFIDANNLDIKTEDLISVGINGGNKYHIYLIDILSKIYEEGVISPEDLTKILSKKQIVLDDYEKELIKNFVKPNLVINEEETKLKIENNIKALKNNTIVIKKRRFYS